MKFRIPFVAAAATAAALSLPAGAAAHSDPSLSSVRAHAERADKYLDRALDRLRDGRDRSAERWYDRARRELRRGEADARRLRRAADTVAERSRAARAYWAVGDQADENVEVLLEMLDESRGHFREAIADVIDRDLHARDRAIRLIAALVEDGVSEEALAGLTAALQSLTAGREAEIEEMLALLEGGTLSPSVLEMIEEAIGDAVEDQRAASQRLQALLDGDLLSPEAREAVAAALESVTAAQVMVAQILRDVAAQLPEPARELVGGILEQVAALLGGERAGEPPLSGVLPLPVLGDLLGGGAGGLPGRGDVPLPGIERLPLDDLLGGR